MRNLLRKDIIDLTIPKLIEVLDGIKGMDQELIYDILKQNPTEWYLQG